MAFLDVTFPDDVARGLTVTRERKTRVIEAESSREERLPLWSQSRITINCEFQYYDDTSKRKIIDFFEVVKGPFYSFRVRNWLDFEVGYEYTNAGAWSVTTPEQFATGDGTATVFQLRRKYAVGSIVAYRKVTKPRNDLSAPVKIYIGGVLQTSGYTINYSTGLVTFSSAPSNGSVITWAGLYDICCRFEEERMAVVANSRFVARATNLTLREVDE